jgi:hypothetical protein
VQQLLRVQNLTSSPTATAGSDQTLERPFGRVDMVPCRHTAGIACSTRSQRSDIGSRTGSSAHRWPTTATRPRLFTDCAPGLANAIKDLIPAAIHHTGQYENTRCEGECPRGPRPGFGRCED